MRICELLSGRFLQKFQIYKHITHFQYNSIISVKLHFVQFGFLLRPGHGPIYDLVGGGGEGRKEENPSQGKNGETKDIKVQEMYKKMTLSV